MCDIACISLWTCSAASYASNNVSPHQYLLHYFQHLIYPYYLPQVNKELTRGTTFHERNKQSRIRGKDGVYYINLYGYIKWDSTTETN